MMPAIGRKAGMAWASLAATNLWLATGLLTEGGYIALVTLIFGFYAGANVVAKRMTNKEE